MRHSLGARPGRPHATATSSVRGGGFRGHAAQCRVHIGGGGAGRLRRGAAGRGAADGLTAAHAAQIRQAVYDGRLLRFPDPAWRCAYLGAGEEKACFGVRDADGRMFVLEVIDERTYLNGRFVGGAYFGDQRVPGLAGVPKSARATVGLRFTGRSRPGSGCTATSGRVSRGGRTGAAASTRCSPDTCGWSSAAAYDRYRRQYSDVHERNVMFEVRPARAGECRCSRRDLSGRIRLMRVGSAADRPALSGSGRGDPVELLVPAGLHLGGQRLGLLPGAAPAHLVPVAVVVLPPHDPAGSICGVHVSPLSVAFVTAVGEGVRSISAFIVSRVIPRRRGPRGRGRSARRPRRRPRPAGGAPRRPGSPPATSTYTVARPRRRCQGPSVTRTLWIRAYGTTVSCRVSRPSTVANACSVSPAASTRRRSGASQRARSRHRRQRQRGDVEPGQGQRHDRPGGVDGRPPAAAGRSRPGSAGRRRRRALPGDREGDPQPALGPPQQRPGHRQRLDAVHRHHLAAGLQQAVPDAQAPVGGPPIRKFQKLRMRMTGAPMVPATAVTMLATAKNAELAR